MFGSWTFTTSGGLLEKIAPYMGGDSEKAQELLNLFWRIQSYVEGNSERIQELLNLLKVIQSYIVSNAKNVQELLHCLSLSSFPLQLKQEIRKLIVDVFVNEPLEPDFELDGDRRAIVEEMRDNWYIKLINEEEYDCKWIKIIMHLPKIKDKWFDWLDREYFILKGNFSQEALKQELQLHPEYKEKLESNKGISEILESFRQYMKVRKVVVDKKIEDYYKYFDWENCKHKTCEIWEILKWIEETWLRWKQFRLQDGVVFDCSKWMCRFIYSYFSKNFKILLRLS